LINYLLASKRALCQWLCVADLFLIYSSCHLKVVNFFNRWGCTIWSGYQHRWNCRFFCKLCLGAGSCKGVYIFIYLICLFFFPSFLLVEPYVIEILDSDQCYQCCYWGSLSDLKCGRDSKESQGNVNAALCWLEMKYYPEILGSLGLLLGIISCPTWQ
jgi:hypothetical protein